MKKISVIIPMYNARQTIRECIESLIAQSFFSDLELIIVDDCSDDSSPDIIMEYENKYPDNILLIQLDKNAGPGNARNVAMEYASGEYIGFVDADDAVYPTMYERLYKEAVRTGADFVDSGFYDQKKDRAIVFVSDELAGELDDKKRSDLIVAGGFIWSKLFRKGFLIDKGIRFRNEYVLEDTDFLVECVARAERISTVKEILYIYRNSGGSLSKRDQSLEYLHNQSSAMKAIFDRTGRLSNYSGIQEAVEFVMLHLYSNVINTCMNLVYLNEQPEEIIKQILDSMRKLKKSIIREDYDSVYIKKGFNDINLSIIKANDVSSDVVLSMLKNHTKE